MRSSGQSGSDYCRSCCPPPRALRCWVNPGTGRMAKVITADVQAAAFAIGGQVEVLTASTNRQIDTAFATVVQKRIDALIQSPDPFFATRRSHIIVLAARHAVPVIYPNREDADAGGLM